jgi:predicted metal-dependent hydrolase
MQLDLTFELRPLPAGEERLRVGAVDVPLRLVRNRRARRYILRLRSDGSAQVTVPSRGSAREAWKFAERNIPWLEKQLLRRATQTEQVKGWVAGTEILFRGERARINVMLDSKGAVVGFGSETVLLSNYRDDLRPQLEKHLWALAARELPPRALELAAMHRVDVRRVTVRNQRSRWGSCSRRGTVSLNWRLVQTPDFVRDYIILHELAHFREMNHSQRFWQQVERLCPDFATAERWLKTHAHLLR